MRFLALLGLVALCGCSEARHEPRLGSTREAIIGGSADTTHPAVVALKLVTNGAAQFGRCSGTIIEVDGNVGTVLTAAHCFEANPNKVTITTGPDFSAPEATFTATSWVTYQAAGVDVDVHRDLALVKFEGTTQATPRIALTPANTYASYKQGSPFTVVGYGRVDADGSVPNTIRKQLGLTFSVNEESWIVNTSPVGSTCFGDSGGAVLDKSSGTETLSGVTQGGNCALGDVNAAVGFYQPEITAWLRANGIDQAAATKLPDNADCSTDDQCASGACQDFLDEQTGKVVILCGAPNENGFSCSRPAQCQSQLCDRLICKESAVSDAGADAATDAGATVGDAGADAGAPASGGGDTDDGCATTDGDVTRAIPLFALVGLALVLRRRRKIA